MIFQVSFVSCMLAGAILCGYATSSAQAQQLELELKSASRRVDLATHVYFQFDIRNPTQEEISILPPTLDYRNFRLEYWTKEQGLSDLKFVDRGAGFGLRSDKKPIKLKPGQTARYFLVRSLRDYRTSAPEFWKSISGVGTLQVNAIYTPQSSLDLKLQPRVQFVAETELLVSNLIPRDYELLEKLVSTDEPEGISLYFLGESGHKISTEKLTQFKGKFLEEEVDEIVDFLLLKHAASQATDSNRDDAQQSLERWYAQQPKIQREALRHGLGIKGMSDTVLIETPER